MSKRNRRPQLASAVGVDRSGLSEAISTAHLVVRPTNPPRIEGHQPINFGLRSIVRLVVELREPPFSEVPIQHWSESDWQRLEEVVKGED